MEKQKIVVCDHIHESGLQLLEKAPNIDFVNASDVDKTALLDVISDADLIITRSSTDVDEKLLNATKKLKAIIRAGVGVDNVDIDGCTERDIIVMNVPTANTIAAVELTMTHIMSNMRFFPYAHNHLKTERIWKREKWYGHELKGKKLGIIGFGNIGSRVGKRAKAFEMDVMAYDPYIDPTKATDVGVEYVEDFERILAESDIITIHTPKNRETIDMINSAEIEKMKDDVVLINCARGGLYNEEALYNGLKSGKIRSAGIDVFSKEPATDHPLLELDNITVTPHLGANTYESQRNIGTQAAQNALEAVKGISYPNALNLPGNDGKDSGVVKKYRNLIQKIGFISAQLNKGSIKCIKVFAEGEDVVAHRESLMTFATLGALKESLGDSINYVNAKAKANGRGIDVSIGEFKDGSGFKNRVGVKITTAENRTIRVAGTIFGDESERIVEVDGFDLDVKPEGKIILFKNSDVPGVIGAVGQTLANHNINIADFRLGRHSEGNALAVIHTDETACDAVLKELSELEACLSVSYVEV
jgi:D-3-phosphoglycerate dehydrogenase